MKISLVSLSFICLIFFSLSCTKDNLPNAGGDDVYKIISYGAKSPGTKDSVVFHYDSENRVTEMVGYGNYIPAAPAITTVAFEYDGQGRFIKHVFGNNATGNIFSYTYSYNSDGKIIKGTGTALLPNFNEPGDRVYTYDTKGKLIADTFYFAHTPVKTEYSAFRYDDNDNVVEVTKVNYNFTSGQIQDQGVYSLKYDNYISAFIKTGMMLFLSDASNNPGVLSKNNIIATSQVSASTRYYYYSNGLPKTASFTDTQGTSLSEYYYK